MTQSTPDTTPTVTEHDFAARENRPGKVLALHLNYPSRIAQRGRSPQVPGYFIKAGTSIARSGDAVERPAGTELLAYEGEIALIIGRTARRVTPEEGWSHVSGITAANDWGLYDLRHADKGSNVKNKSGDGYTPLGPAVISAEGLDPAALRVRTWFNGEIVQDDTTEGLVFPFGQLVADLSQLMTLEEGDVILTGTPAGSSVARPGDVVEVEVDAPTAPGAPTTGRLVTRVTESEHAMAPFGAQPKVDDVQREEAWGSREAAGLPAASDAQADDGAAASQPAAGSPARPGGRERPLGRERPAAGPLPADPGAARQDRRRRGGHPHRPAAEARHPERDHRRPAPDPPGSARPRLRQDPALRAQARGPVQGVRRRLQRPEAGHRLGAAGRRGGHGGPWRARHRHPRGRPGPARPGERRERRDHGRRHPRLRRRGRGRPPGLRRRHAPGRAGPPSHPVGGRRHHRLRRHHRAARRRHRRRRRRCGGHPAVPAPGGRGRRLRAGAPGRLGVRAGQGRPPGRRDVPPNAEWKATFDEYRKTLPDAPAPEGDA